MMVALQFSELAAHYPLAGSVYQWSKQVAGKAWAWQHGLDVPVRPDCDCARGGAGLAGHPAADLARSSSSWVRPANSLNFYTKDFAENAIILGIVMIVLTTIINAAGVSVLSKINNVGVASELIGAAGLVILFLIHANRSPSEVLTNTAGTGAGHAWGYLGALLIGAIMPLYVMYGFDSAGSLAEETDDPRKKAPRAILQALATAGTMGFLLILFGTMAVGDTLYKDPTALSLTVITKDVLGNTWGNLFLIDCAFAIFVCCLAIHAMSVRILFAMGRDNNLPGAARLASVSGTRRVPVFPAVLVGVIAIAILAFNIYNQYAFEVIIALGIVYMYIAYLGVNIPLLRNRLNGWPGNVRTDSSRTLFSLGPFAILTNVLAVLYGAAMSINLMWPREEFYGTLWYQKYGPLTGVVVAMGAGLILYFGYQKNKMGVLAEHQAGPSGVDNLGAQMNEPPPIHGGP